MRIKVIISSLFTIGVTFSQIIINEVFYDPSGVDTGQEWIELKNVGVSSVDITGYDLNATSGDYFTFPSLSVPAGDFVIVLWNTDGTNDTDFSDNLAHIYTGSTGFANMGNTSGWVAFFNSTTHSSSTIIDYMEYGSGGHTWESSAVSAGIWTAGDFATDVPEGHSLEYDGAGNAGTDWFDQTIPTEGSDNSLPVELSYFKAEKTPEGVLLKWHTESEFENLGFIIERKTKNTNWVAIVSYKNNDALFGQGTVSFPTDYEYTDRLVEKGETYFYRLIDVDFDGVLEYHQKIEISIESHNLPSVADNFSVYTYPNPFNPNTTIRYSLSSNSYTHIAIYDITGKLINTLVNANKSIGWHEIQWDGTNNKSNKVPGGIYFCKVSVGNEIKTNKLILLK